MITLKGRYGSADIFTDNCEESAMNQIKAILNNPVSENANIKIMPDVHSGAGCVIGTTMMIHDKIIPNFVGVDIGCGMLVQCLGNTPIDLKHLDAVIRQYIPHGFSTHDDNNTHSFATQANINGLACRGEALNEKAVSRAYQSIGTLGGGNHFIEINIGNDGSQYLIIHSGSRNLGKLIADYYQKLAYKQMEVKPEDKSMAYLTGDLMNDYLHDMQIAQNYASINRDAIADIIQRGMGWECKFGCETIHNYINFQDNVLRKGAVSAKANERLVIPMNMRDGTLLCVGKGNPDWNNSAPHGAGRIMSRTQAREMIALEDYQKTMEGIFSTCIGESTVDEAPFAYKPMQEIIDNIHDSVYITEVVKPIYNFKSTQQ